MPERQCPRCSEALVFGRFGPLELDICRICGGVWFDTGELSRLNTAGPGVVRRLYESITPQPPTCPTCAATMRSVDFAGMPGVRVDCCPKCEGDWVSHTALLRLAEALGSSGAPAPAPAPVYSAPPPTPAVTPRATPAPTPGQARPYTPPAPQPAAASAQPAAKPGEMVCPHCNEKNSDRAAVCWACGKALEGPVVGNCPRCDAAMRRRESEGVTLDACEGCGGVCVTPKRLNQLILQPLDRVQKLVAQVERFRPDRSKRANANPACPHCKTAFILSRMGMLTQKPVNSCPQCFGLFVDNETLKDILLGQHR